MRLRPAVQGLVELGNGFRGIAAALSITSTFFSEKSDELGQL